MKKIPVYILINIWNGEWVDLWFWLFEFRDYTEYSVIIYLI